MRALDSAELIGLHFDTLTLPESGAHQPCTLCMDDPLHFVNDQFAMRGFSLADMFPDASLPSVPVQVADASTAQVENVSLMHPFDGLKDSLSHAVTTGAILLLAVGLVLLGLWWIINA